MEHGCHQGNPVNKLSVLGFEMKRKDGFRVFRVSYPCPSELHLQECH